MDRANPEADQRAWDSVLPPGQSLLAIHVKSREFQRAVGDRARLVSSRLYSVPTARRFITIRVTTARLYHGKLHYRALSEVLARVCSPRPSRHDFLIRTCASSL